MKEKIIIFGIIFLFLFSSMPIMNSMEINSKETKDTENMNIASDDEYYVGKMTIYGGSFPLYDDWYVDIEPNKNFGGSDREIILDHGECSYKVWAEYEIINDCPIACETWDFYLDLYSYDYGEHGPMHLTSKWIDDDPVIDNAHSGRLEATIDYCPVNGYTGFSDGFVENKINLEVEYGRNGEYNKYSKKTNCADIVALNEPPTAPTIEGPEVVSWNWYADDHVDIEYSMCSTDSDGDPIEYGYEIFYESSTEEWFEWKDKEFSSGEKLTITYEHIHLSGKILIRARARDNYFCSHGIGKDNAGYSEWSEFETEVKFKLSKQSINSLFKLDYKFLDLVPLFQKILY